MSTKSRKRRCSYSDDVWPKRRPIVARKMNNWLSIKNILINEKLLTFHQFHEFNINIMLSSSTLTLIYNGLCQKYHVRRYMTDLSESAILHPIGFNADQMINSI